MCRCTDKHCLLIIDNISNENLWPLVNIVIDLGYLKYAEFLE